MEKVIFKQDFSDFGNLNFHDCSIYAFGFDKESYQFLIDIDLIINWLEIGESFTFELCPATVVFNNAWDIEFDISINLDLIIDNISRTNPRIPKNIEFLPKSSIEYDWTIDTLQGSIKLKSIGMSIYQRKDLCRQKEQTLSFNKRDSISLNKEGQKLFPVVSHSSTD